MVEGAEGEERADETLDSCPGIRPFMKIYKDIMEFAGTHLFLLIVIGVVIWAAGAASSYGYNMDIVYFVAGLIIAAIGIIDIVEVLNLLGIDLPQLGNR